MKTRRTTEPLCRHVAMSRPHFRVVSVTSAPVCAQPADGSLPELRSSVDTVKIFPADFKVSARFVEIRLDDVHEKPLERFRLGLPFDNEAKKHRAAGASGTLGRLNKRHNNGEK